ncbi:permease [Polymorphum gilvum]|uniref:Permease n=1 Tax=Polymorphum gilvum (strain LMG 25793 / CGMCC 1.9160 / SL003B-26A1) TaxID=991905 RepID=F2IYY3_POLGS|nr:permease [Polymorphum gilvum]ADZ70598.1 hypothetical protein SL003B_2173 [Polymorphum gilvum SL003B-26A1]
MTVAIVALLWGIVVVLGGAAVRKGGVPALRGAGDFALKTGLSIVPRLVFALLAASFLSKLIPAEWIVSAIGRDSGTTGILIASVAGGLLPGGPMSSFPIAVFLWQFGAGVPQMVALLVGWSVFAFHRVIAYELPLLGWRFAAIRLLSTFMMPPLAGLIAAGLLAWLGEGAAPLPPAQ